VGIDDFPWANAVTPRLTVVRQPVAEIGRAAVRLLLDRATAEVPQPPVHQVLRPSLVIRDSCAPFPLQ
jgi:LacI family transcriptional regulator